MKTSPLALFFTLLFACGVPGLQAQQIPHAGPILKVAQIPAGANMCTLYPTERNAHFTVRPGPEIMQRLKTSASATFDVDYKVPGNNACGNSVWPEEVYEAFDFAMDIWGAHISSPIPIKIEALWTELEERVLGSARADVVVQLNGTPWPNTWYTTSQASALIEEDVLALVGVEYDILMSINCAFDDWYFGTDGNPPAGAIDFVTVVLHEIGHGIGFSGTLGALPGEEEDEFLEIAAWGLISDDVPYPLIYDQFAKDGDGHSILDEGVYANPSEDLYEALTGNRNGIIFDGTEAEASLEGFSISDAVLYTPAEFRPGSSYSHLDQWTFTDTPNALMRPNMDRALAVHSPGPLFCAMLNDMEWPLGPACLSFMAADAVIALSAQEIDFGVTNVNQTAERTITIRNEEEATEPLSGNLSVDHDYFQLQSSSFSLEPGESVAVPVQYQPGNATIHQAEITLFHNGRNVPTPITIPLQGEALPADEIVQLEPSFPNPVVGGASTPVIPYAISEDVDVKIDLYTVDGRLVRNLLDSRQNSGRYEIDVNMQGLAGGVYIYRMMIGDKVESGKLMYVK